MKTYLEGFLVCHSSYEDDLPSRIPNMPQHLKDHKSYLLILKLVLAVMGMLSILVTYLCPKRQYNEFMLPSHRHLPDDTIEIYFWVKRMSFAYLLGFVTSFGLAFALNTSGTKFDWMQFFGSTYSNIFFWLLKFVLLCILV